VTRELGRGLVEQQLRELAAQAVGQVALDRVAECGLRIVTERWLHGDHVLGAEADDELVAMDHGRHVDLGVERGQLAVAVANRDPGREPDRHAGTGPQPELGHSCGQRGGHLEAEVGHVERHGQRLGRELLGDHAIERCEWQRDPHVRTTSGRAGTRGQGGARGLDVFAPASTRSHEEEAYEKPGHT
jgi:hypothetical protein